MQDFFSDLPLMVGAISIVAVLGWWGFSRWLFGSSRINQIGKTPPGQLPGDDDDNDLISTLNFRTRENPELASGLTRVRVDNAKRRRLPPANSLLNSFPRKDGAPTRQLRDTQSQPQPGSGRRAQRGRQQPTPRLGGQAGYHRERQLEPGQAQQQDRSADQQRARSPRTNSPGEIQKTGVESASADKYRTAAKQMQYKPDTEARLKIPASVIDEIKNAATKKQPEDSPSSGDGAASKVAADSAATQAGEKHVSPVSESDHLSAASAAAKAEQNAPDVTERSANQRPAEAPSRMSKLLGFALPSLNKPADHKTDAELQSGGNEIGLSKLTRTAKIGQQSALAGTQKANPEPAGVTTTGTVSGQSAPVAQSTAARLSGANSESKRHAPLIRDLTDASTTSKQVSDPDKTNYKQDTTGSKQDEDQSTTATSIDNELKHHTQRAQNTAAEDSSGANLATEVTRDSRHGAERKAPDNRSPANVSGTNTANQHIDRSNTASTGNESAALSRQSPLTQETLDKTVQRALDPQSPVAAPGTNETDQNSDESHVDGALTTGTGDNDFASRSNEDAPSAQGSIATSSNEGQSSVALPTPGLIDKKDQPPTGVRDIADTQAANETIQTDGKKDRAADTRAFDTHSSSSSDSTATANRRHSTTDENSSDESARSVASSASLDSPVNHNDNASERLHSANDGEKDRQIAALQQQLQALQTQSGQHPQRATSPAGATSHQQQTSTASSHPDGDRNAATVAEQNKQLQQQLQDSKARIATLQSQISGQNPQSIVGSDDSNNTTTSSTAAANNSDQGVTELRARIAELEAHSRQQEDYQQRCSNAEQQLSAAQKQLEQLANEGIPAATAKVGAKLQQALETSETHVAELQQRIETLQQHAADNGPFEHNANTVSLLEERLLELEAHNGQLQSVQLRCDTAEQQLIEKQQLLSRIQLKLAQANIANDADSTDAEKCKTANSRPTLLSKISLQDIA